MTRPAAERLRLVAEVLAWLLALAALVALPRHWLLLNEIAILALFAVSLDLVLGFAGIVSLGHAAFLGLGAYVAGLLARAGWQDPLLGLAAASAAAGLLGLLTGPLLLRGSDLTRLMVTLGIAMMLGEVANRWADLTGGADGLQGIEAGPLLGLLPFDLGGRTAYGYSLAVLFVLVMLARRLVRSPFGLSLRAIRANPLRARLVGVPVGGRLVAIYGIAAAIAGAAGALLAQTTQFVSPDVFDVHRSAEVLLVLVLGGVGWLYGGIVGAILFKGLQAAFMALTATYWQFWIGLVLVTVVVVGRDRLGRWGRRLVDFGRGGAA